MSVKPCPCGLPSTYAECCQPFHGGSAIPATPEQLMRSRYSAFCEREVEYLIATTAAEKRQTDDQAVISQTAQATRWLSLWVLNSSQSRDGLCGYVEFVAFFAGEPVGQLHEKSSFIKREGRWFYVDGSILPPIKISRNDPCWCGSGRKLKKCHAKNG